MTVLDTFYLLFKSDAKETTADTKELEKTIDALTAKGKKRSEAETKQLTEAKKQLKSVTTEFKDQQKAVDGLRSSFVGLIEGAVGAFTAYAGFSAIKSGILDVAKLNSALFVQQQITGQSAGELKGWAAEVEAAGGSAEGFLGTLSSMTQKAAEAGLPLRKITDLMRYFHNLVQGLPEQEQRRLLLLNGIADPGMIALLEKSNDDFEKSIGLIQRHAEATNAAAKVDREFEQQLSRTGNAWDDFLSKMGKSLLPGATSALGTTQEFLEGYEGGMKWNPDKAPAGILGRWFEHHVMEPLFGAPKKSPSASSGGGSDDEKSAFDYWTKQGYSPTQAAALVGNMRGEGWKLGGAPGDGGTAFGIAQWHSDRVSKILKETGIDVRTAGISDQLRAQDWEMRQMGVNPLTLPNNTAGGADFLVRNYEKSRNQDRDSYLRGRYAVDALGRYSGSLGGGGGSAAPASKSISVKIGDVSVNTQATSSADIARGISSHLANEMRNAVTSIDDGVLA